MAHIEPFESVHYNPQSVQEIAKVVCPPYDIINAEEQEELYQRHPYNLVRLILGKDFAADTDAENKYTRSAGYIEEWLRRDILVQDEAPAVYFYEQVFSSEGETKKRLGFTALLRLDEEGGRTVHPHEHTHTAPKEDRFKLIQRVEANLSPVFTIFSDPQAALKAFFQEKIEPAPPLFDITDARGLGHRVWRVDEPGLVGKVKEMLADKEVFIADGHHRYEVARMFRDLKKKQDPSLFKDSYNYIMTYFTALEDEGLVIWPTHRLIKNVRFSADDLTACFAVKEMESPGALSDEMKGRRGEIGVFGLYKGGKAYLLRASEKRECNRFIQDGPKEYKNLDVVILHKVIFEHFLKITLSQIHYEVDLDAAVKSVDNERYDALFLLNPTRVEQIRSIALGGEVMPQKSTYFYPKLMSGFFIHKF